MQLQLSLLLASFAFLIPPFRCAPLEDQPQPDHPDLPMVLPPRAPLSQIVFVSDLPPGQPVTYSFEQPAHVYVASAKDEETKMYESNVQISMSENGQQSFNMIEAGGKVDERGRKHHMFDVPSYKFTVVNHNSDRSNSRTPGIIYFCFGANDTFKSTVYEPNTYRQDIHHEGDKMEHEYVTLLNPTGAVKLTDIRHIMGLTQLAITAGGVEEAQFDENRIYTVTSIEAHSEAPVIVMEPIITLQKLVTLLPTDFELTAEAYTPQKEITIPMDWNDWSIAMSPNYKLRNTSNSVKIIFNGTEEETQYDLTINGYVGRSSKLTISSEGYDGISSETLSQRHFHHDWMNRKGRQLTIEYNKGNDDQEEEGVIVRVRCKQPAAALFLYVVFGLVTFKYLFDY